MNYPGSRKKDMVTRKSAKSRSEPSRSTGHSNHLPRVLTLKDATMLVVSSVIGVGIFLTPDEVAKLLPNPFWFCVAWLAGGVLSLAGALANAELGAMFPRAGGNYVYLRAAYHPMVGFLIGWLQFFAIFAGTVATLATGFTKSLNSLFSLSPAWQLAMAMGLIWITTAVNAYATRAGAWLNTVTAYVKVASLVALVILGPILGSDRAAALPLGHGGSVTIEQFGVAFSPVIFSYLGWNASVYVAGEIERPGRNLPRSLFWGLGICSVIYLGVNATYVYAVGMDALAEPAAAVAVGKVLFGERGGLVVVAMMLVSIFGSLNATVLVGPRIAYAMANDGLFFGGAARVSQGSGTPWVAVVVQAMVATALVIVFHDLRSVLDYTTFAIVLATIADTSALYVLRYREPHRDRPYRAWGYPALPMLYILANIAIAASLVFSRPRECLTSLGVVLVGVPIYWLFMRCKAV
jgi:APA family basic amino acid/polyamine antiporter